MSDAPADADTELEPIDLPTVTVQMLDKLAAARAAGNSMVDHHTAILTELDLLMAHREEIAAAMPPPVEEVPEPHPEAAPMAAPAAYEPEPVPATEA